MRTIIVIAALCAGAGASAAPPSPPTPAVPPDSTVVATYDGARVTLADLRARTSGGPGDLRRALREIVDQDLLRREAARRGVSERQLLQAEVADKVAAPTAEEIEGAYRRLRAIGRIPVEMPLERFREPFVASRRARAEAELERAFLASLRASAHLSIDETLPELRPITRLDRAVTVSRRGETPPEAKRGARPMPGIDHSGGIWRPSFTAPAGGSAPPR